MCLVIFHLKHCHSSFSKIQLGVGLLVWTISLSSELWVVRFCCVVGRSGSDMKNSEKESIVISNINIILWSFSVRILQTKLLCCGILCAEHFGFRLDHLEVCVWVPTGRVASPVHSGGKDRSYLIQSGKTLKQTSPQKTPTDSRKTEIALTNVTHFKINPREQLQPATARQPLLKGCFVWAGVHPAR